MLRSVLTIIQGSALAQVAGFLVLPLLSRTFEPVAFGNLQVYQSVMMMVMAVLMLRYEIAILRASEGQELNEVLGLCAFLMLIVTTLLTLGVVAGSALGWVPFMVRVSFGWWWLPLSALAIGWAQIFSYLATRDANYGLIAKGKVAQGLTNAVGSAALAMTAPIGSGLIIADFTARVVNGYAISRRRMFRAAGLLNASASGMVAVARRYSDLSFISLPSAVINTMGLIATPLFIYATFDAAMAGQYSLVERAVGLPVALIVVAISQVHMGNLSEDLRNGTNKARARFRRISIFLASLALLPTVLCIAFSPILFNFFFGQGWDQAARFAQILAPAYYLSLISGGINMTLTVVGRQIVQLIFDVSRLGMIGLLWIGAQTMNWHIERILVIHAFLICIYSVIQLFISYRALPSSQDIGEAEDALP